MRSMARMLPLCPELLKKIPVRRATLTWRTPQRGPAICQPFPRSRSPLGIRWSDARIIHPQTTQSR
jgi:hypothetical protein